MSAESVNTFKNRLDKWESRVKETGCLQCREAS